MRPKAWYVYIVRCADASLYTGATDDVAKRVAAHNAGTGARYTRSRRPVTVVYTRRAASKSRALSVEAQLKQLSRPEKLALIASRTSWRPRATGQRAARIVKPRRKF